MDYINFSYLWETGPLIWEKKQFYICSFFFWPAKFRPQIVPQHIFKRCNKLNINNITQHNIFYIEKTGENTLGKALNRMEANGIVFPQLLKVAFDKLYAYTNQPDTGIRHALMDNEGAYTPASEEALFMLVSCSAFLNYLCKKIN